MNADLVVTIVVAMLAGGGIAGLINALNARKKAKSEIKNTEAVTEKTEAETTDLIVKTAAGVLVLVKDELKSIKDENTALRCEVTEWKTKYADVVNVQQRHEQEIAELQKIAEQFDEVLGGAHVLYDQVVELKAEPKYKPPERRKKD
jgi:ribosome-binding ATPase YchF (GTP1/OBG family)